MPNWSYHHNALDYPSESAAKAMRNDLRRSGKCGRVKWQAVRCNECKSWHVEAEIKSGRGPFYLCKREVRL